MSELTALLFSLAATVLSVSIVLWLPWLTNGGWTQVFARMFPFERGLFEDKVANFWCVSSLLVKWKEVLDQGTLALLAAVATLLVTVPSLLFLWKKTPTSLQFLLALGNSAMSFFLFSYHVHEKAILLPLFPYLMVSSLEAPSLFPFINTISVFSLYPLLVKDGLRAYYFPVTCVTYALSHYISRGIQSFLSSSSPRTDLVTVVTRGYLVCGVLIHMLETLEPPARYPYLFDTLIAAYSFLGFLALWGYFNWKQWKLPESEDTKSYLDPSFRHKPKFA